MLPQRLFLIINPKSGTETKEGIDRMLSRELADRGFEITSVFTRGPGDATELARQAVADGFDGVLACGGDGTVNETACGMVGTGVPMGIVPMGSGNGLARHLNIPIDPLMSLDVVAKRFVRDCDYGDVNGRPFFCTFGVGFDAAVSDRFAASGSRGRINYVRSAVHEFINYKPSTYSIVADGEVIDDEALLVAVCNANQYGNNAFIAPDASIKDGYLDLVVVRNMPKINTVWMSVEMMWGTLTESRHIIKRKVKNVVINRKEPGPAHLDGEPFHVEGNRMVVSSHPGSLKLFTTDNKTPFRPVFTPVHAFFDDMSIAIKHLFLK